MVSGFPSGSRSASISRGLYRSSSPWRSSSLLSLRETLSVAVFFSSKPLTAGAGATVSFSADMMVSGGLGLGEQKRAGEDGKWMVSGCEAEDVFMNLKGAGHLHAEHAIERQHPGLHRCGLGGALSHNRNLSMVGRPLGARPAPWRRRDKGRRAPAESWLASSHEDRTRDLECGLRRCGGFCMELACSPGRTGTLIHIKFRRRVVLVLGYQGEPEEGCRSTASRRPSPSPRTDSRAQYSSVHAL